MPQSFTEADAQAYAKRVGVRIETARSALSVESESRDRASATRAAACAAAAAQIVRLHAVANGVKPKAVAMKSLAAKAPDTSGHKAAAASVVALFNKVNRSQEAS